APLNSASSSAMSMQASSVGAARCSSTSDMVAPRDGRCNADDVQFTRIGDERCGVGGFGYAGRGMTVYETTSHQVIYHWATGRGLWPACVKGSPDRIRLGGDDSANPGEEVEPLEWWRWFQEFERRQLQLIYDPSKGWFTLGSRLAPTGA